MCCIKGVVTVVIFTDCVWHEGSVLQSIQWMMRKMGHHRFPLHMRENFLMGCNEESLSAFGQSHLKPTRNIRKLFFVSLALRHRKTSKLPYRSLSSHLWKMRFWCDSHDGFPRHCSLHRNFRASWLARCAAKPHEGVEREPLSQVRRPKVERLLVQTFHCRAAFNLYLLNILDQIA